MVADRMAEGKTRCGGRRVLIVDDNPDLAKSLAMLLQLLGYDADFALSGSEGLSKAEAQTPDVVVLDLCMAGMDGLAVARRLRQTFADRVRLVAWTGLDSPEDLRRCLDAGFDRHFVKPADLDQLERALRA